MKIHEIVRQCSFLSLFDWLIDRLFVCLIVCLFVRLMVCLFDWLFSALLSRLLPNWPGRNSLPALDARKSVSNNLCVILWYLFSAVFTDAIFFSYFFVFFYTASLLSSSFLFFFLYFLFCFIFFQFIPAVRNCRKRRSFPWNSTPGSARTVRSAWSATARLTRYVRDFSYDDFFELSRQICHFSCLFLLLRDFSRRN